MKKIEIKNLGPITNLDLNLNSNLNIIIGPQASGKSTIGKILYFCKKIKDYYVDFISQDSIFMNTHPNELYISFLKHIRKNFMGCFGTTKHFDPPFSILYYYSKNNKNISISLKEGYAHFKFSNILETEIKNSFMAAYKIYHENSDRNKGDFISNFTNILQLKTEVQKHFTQLSEELFCSKEDILYIPAGRSLLSVLSDQIESIDTSILDLPMKDFIERIRLTKSRFGTKLNALVNDYLKTVKGQIKNNDIAIAQELIKNILKAEYINDSDSEKLFFDEKHWVKLNYGSSGQQESLWILLLLFIVILENKKTFIILEEPEAHLYPNAQKYIMELISLTMNSSSSEAFITTHSPYILSATNLLIHSGIVENNPKIINEKYEDIIVKKQLRIDPTKVNAYKIMETNSFKCESIIDSKSGMILSFAIDTISEIINSEAEKLLELEIKHDL